MIPNLLTETRIACNVAVLAKNPIGYLVRSRFPGVPLEDQILGLNDLLPPRQKEREAAEKYQSELQALDPDELANRISQQRKRDEIAAALKARQDEANRPYNRPEGNADFEYWAKMSTWTIDEAVALSFGKNPKYASWKYIQSIANVSQFARDYAAKREIVVRAKEAGQLRDFTYPNVFLAWAKRMRLAVPGELLKEVEALGIQIADWKTLYDNQVAEKERYQSAISEVRTAHLADQKSHSKNLAKVVEDQKFFMAQANAVIEKRDGIIAAKEARVEALLSRVEELEAKPATVGGKGLGAKERESFLKMVIGMAIDGYGYDPKAARSPISKEIADHLALVALPLDEDTVRKYLNEAKQLLPSDETEQKAANRIR